MEVKLNYLGAEGQGQKPNRAVHTHRVQLDEGRSAAGVVAGLHQVQGPGAHVPEGKDSHKVSSKDGRKGCDL